MHGTPRSLRIIVTGLIAHYPLGGMTWHYLNYVLGLARLGHDVVYLEDTGAWPFDPTVDGLGKDCRFNVSYLDGIMSRHGLSDRWAYRFDYENRWFGMSERRRQEALATADLLINVSGSLGHPEKYRSVRRMAFIDTDPVFTQIKLAKRQEPFRRDVSLHDVWFTFGECLSADIPATGFDWLPTRQPVVLSEWAPSQERREAFTTVMNWTSYKDIVFEGRRYGQKDVEMKKFIDLPSRAEPAVLELAIATGKTRRTPVSLLEHNRWRLVDPARACSTAESYRDYIRASKAEFSVAKEAYVTARSGWFSERSACYLAAGRPVVLQDTGYSRVLPTGSGLLPFGTPEEALEAIRRVEADHTGHAVAAREVAEECFDSDRVLTSLIERAG